MRLYFGVRSPISASAAAGCRRGNALALGDEVGLAVDLDQHANLRRVVGSGAMQVCLDDALAGRSPGSLGRLGDSLLAKDGVRLLEVALGLLERVLAVHHSRA